MTPLLAALALAAAPPDSGRAIRPFLERHCVACHGAEKPKGAFRLDGRLSSAQWLAAVKRVRVGEMPPPPKPRPTAKEVEALAAWNPAPAAGRVVLRRLNRVEYENTVRDLLGVEVDLEDLLPPDTSAHGFDNVAEALHVLSFLMERYLEAADTALALAIANGPQPPKLAKRFGLEGEHAVKLATERVFLRRDDTLVMFSSSPWNAITTGQFYPPNRGRYRVRIAACAHQSGGNPVTYRLEAGPMLMGQKNRLVGYFDAPAGKPAVIEFVDHFEARHSLRILPYGLASAQAVHRVGADKYDGPGLAVQWVEVEGPLHDTWPPESHRRLFGDLPRLPTRGGRVEVVSKDPLVDAERILRGFARRAFRRPVTDADVEPFLGLVKKQLADRRPFEQAVRVGLKGVLASPDFLYLREKPGRLDGPALASRLSYFLWSTTPDADLLALAEKGKLSDPETLRRQVERLLTHPKAAAFTENFVGQWLGLREIDATAPDFRLYPEYDEMLKAAMLDETHRFFDEVLTNDLTLTSFVASDWTMLNERLARHYGVPGVTGHKVRKVKLPPGSPRGGVLTMASVLKVTANGTTTSPVVRGAWVLDRLLGTPPAPPPADVPAVEADIRGATTIREQLAKHRAEPSCAACHAKIDPPGFALESFDVIGGWRDHYRSVGRGTPVTVDGRKMTYVKGPKVDPSGVRADGRAFRDVEGYKRLLLKDKDQLARALAMHLLTYATGGAVGDADRGDVEAIVRKIRDKGYGLRSLVHEIVRSRPFQHK